MSYNTKVFVPKVTHELLAAAARDYPFVTVGSIPLVENATAAANKAKDDYNAKLPSNNCVTGIVSTTLNAENTGWEVELRILD